MNVGYSTSWGNGKRDLRTTHLRVLFCMVDRVRIERKPQNKVVSYMNLWTLDSNVSPKAVHTFRVMFFFRKRLIWHRYPTPKEGFWLWILCRQRCLSPCTSTFPRGPKAKPCPLFLGISYWVTYAEPCLTFRLMWVSFLGAWLSICMCNTWARQACWSQQGKAPGVMTGSQCTVTECPVSAGDKQHLSTDAELIGMEQRAAPLQWFISTWPLQVGQCPECDVMSLQPSTARKAELGLYGTGRQCAMSKKPLELLKPGRSRTTSVAWRSRGVSSQSAPRSWEGTTWVSQTPEPRDLAAWTFCHFSGFFLFFQKLIDAVLRVTQSKKWAWT